MTLILYTSALFVVLVLGLPYWLLAMATSGKYREGLSERLEPIKYIVVEANCRHHKTSFTDDRYGLPPRHTSAMKCS